MSSPELIAALPPAGQSTIEAFVRTLSGEASIGIFLSDPEGHTLYLNDRLRRIAGLPATPTAGECWLNALSPEDHDLISAEWAGAITERRSFAREFRFRRPDGSIRWVMAEAFPLRTAGEASTGYVGMVRDVTPRQLAMEALHASEERYRSLILLSPHAILIHTDGTILFINQAGNRLFGITSAHDIEGRLLSECFPEEFIRGLASPEPPTTSTPTAPVERRLVRPDGTHVDVEMVSAPIMFDGQPAVQVIVTDITAQKETAAQLQQARKTAAIATLAGGIAHEFNNCLTAIMGFSDLTLPLLVPDSRAHGHVQQVVLASKRARDLVTQMLVFGRQGVSAKQPISLDILLKETLRILRGRLPENITLREWIPGATKPVFADPTQIHQMCISLLAHSEQAMRTTGGTLEVRLDNIHLAAPANGHDLPLPPGQYVRLTVSDAAEGMNPDVQARLFDPFFTPTSGGNGMGVGVGLSDVQRIVSEHGGTFHATSTVAQGTTIEVYLPAMSHPNSVVVTEPTQEGPSNLTERKEFLAERDKER
ncbi:MAG: PAS domain S-box protein [Nitrospira defluvii]|nr:PAS domain S-box protein [Nitrospira defluvii]